ncbi:MAG TPA: lysophospholipid acyltransferase family protein [Pyrinomonadaceae bacterium]|nr:lysophospholipid acyltransferase family protein [Pyrinomonadaceae bacterium]
MAESVAYRLIIVASQSASWFFGQFLRVRYEVSADGPPELFAPRHNHCLILAPTHKSYLDPWLLMIGLPYRHFRSLVPVRTLATQDLQGALRWFMPLIKVLYWLGGVIELPPEEQTDKTLPEKLRGLLLALKHGDVVMIFPEGEIHREQEPPVGKFASGVVYVYRRLGSPIVPIATWVSRQRWPRRRYTAQFGPPSRIPDNLDQEEGAVWLRQQVLALYQEMTQRVER